MSKYSTNEFKSGLKVLLDNQPCSIIENEFVKPGKGQAFNRVKLRNLKTGRVLEKTFKSGESLPAADVVELEMQYLYNDGEHWHFMDPNTFDQMTADATAMAETIDWLKEELVCTLILYNGVPLSVAPPNFVHLSVIEADPGVKGDTAQGGSKVIKLESGKEIRGPLFIEVGELLRIDTRTGEYVSRVKDK